MWWILSAFVCAALCQEFDVVSVKPNNSGAYDSHFNTDRAGITATNVTLRGLITRAYGIQDYQLEGPDWISSRRFDVAATIPSEPAGEKEPDYSASLQTMMQHMLVDRFKLVAHREQKTQQVYGLVIGKSGIKFKEASTCKSQGRNRNGTHLVGTCVSMNSLAEVLALRSRDLPEDRPVIDMTGLKGFYDFMLDWIPEPRPSKEHKTDNPLVREQEAGVTLVVALEEQLGLKLETRKAPVDIVVVDHAEKVPSEN